MEPMPKRLRLSMFSRDPPPDASLNTARWRNDLCLKSKFEAIFEKYSHDFTEIGDEIDISTGLIVVNNGHLESMEGEDDTGTTKPPRRAQSKGSTNFDGGSLLRAMTAAPEDHGPLFDNVNDDEVIMSIETIAENAAGYSDDQSADSPSGFARLDDEDGSSDEELFQAADKVILEPQYKANVQSRSPQVIVAPASFRSPEEYGNQAFFRNNMTPEIVIKEEDECDWPDKGSLFEGLQKERSLSPDSLFEMQEDPSSPHHLQLQSQETPSVTAYPELESIDREVSDDAILDKFGPTVGLQVLDVIQKRRAMLDAHIEPAWRVPDIGVAFAPPKLDYPPDDLRLSEKPDDDNQESIWKAPRSSQPMLKKPKRKSARATRRSSQAGDESDDPLQEDFKEAEEDEKLYAGYEQAVSLDDIQEGICPFCQKQFSVRGSIFVHWDDLIKKSVRDGIHDMTFIRDQRSRKRRRTQFPKVTVEDFRRMVKLHEVDKMDWKEMQELGFFGQRPATSLQSIYYQYRMIAKTDEELAHEGRSWTDGEDEQMLELLREHKHLITFQQLRKVMKTRTQAEIGNRLASIWMQQYAEQGIELVDPKIKRNHYFRTIKRRTPDDCHIKKEDQRRSLGSDTFRRSGSEDSVDSLFMADNEFGYENDGDSDDGLFG